MASSAAAPRMVSWPLSRFTICSLRFAPRARFTSSELEREMQNRLVVPIHAAEVDVGRDQTDLVANPLRHERGLRIVKNDAFLLVEQAGPRVDLGDNRVDAQRRNPIPQHA